MTTGDVVMRQRTGPPRSIVEACIGHAWEEVLSLERPAEDLDFFEVGGNSLQAALMLTILRRRNGLEASLRSFFENPTIAGLAAAVAREDSFVVPRVVVSSEGPAPALFMVPASKGEVYFLRHLRSFPRRVIGLRSSGLDQGTPVLRSFEAVVDDFLRLILEAQTSGPYLVGGYCAGSPVAHALASRLAALGHEVEGCVLVTGQPAYGPLGRGLDVERYFVRRVAQQVGCDLPDLPLAESWRFLRDQGAFPDGSALDDFQRRASVIEANLKAAELREPLGVIDCPVVFVEASVPAEEAAAAAEAAAGTAASWRPWASDLRVIPVDAADEESAIKTAGLARSLARELGIEP